MLFDSQSTQQYRLTQFNSAVNRLNLREMRRRLSDADLETRQKMLSEKNLWVFAYAAHTGRYKIIKLFLEFADKATSQFMLTCIDCLCFRDAAKSGKIKIVKAMGEACDKATLEKMLAAENYHAFRRAAKYGHLDILKYLIERSCDEHIPQMLVIRNCYVLSRALSQGHPKIVRYLLKTALQTDSAIYQQFCEHLPKNKKYTQIKRWVESDFKEHKSKLEAVVSAQLNPEYQIPLASIVSLYLFGSPPPKDTQTEENTTRRFLSCCRIG